MGIVIFILVLLVLVLVHEFGHFIVAKKSGIRVDEFGFGFPPKLYGKKFGETEYSFNALPIGGFVRIFGETPDEESEAGEDSARSMTNKPAYIQAFVLVAGVAFNWILAWLLFSIIFILGTPALQSNPVPFGGILSDSALTIFAVTPDSPAQEAGLRGGEQIVSVQAGGVVLLEEDYSTGEVFLTDFRDLLEENKDGIELTYITSASDILQSVTMIPETGIVDDRVAVGVGIDYVGTLRLNPVIAFWEGAKRTWELTGLMVVGFIDFFGGIFTGSTDFSEVAGPVGIAVLVGEASASGLVSLLFITAIISINLAVLNLLPFPALDGGRLLFLLIEVIKGSPIRPQIANGLNAIGFILLILLMLIVTYNDIIKF